MASILTSIQDSIQSNLFSPSSALDTSKLQYYSINGVPMLTYVLLGITTVVLATVTLSESVVSNDEESEPSMLSQLPTVNPFATSESGPSEQKGGKGKKRKTKSNKSKMNKTRTHH
jgi:hypothetical protein